MSSMIVRFPDGDRELRYTDQALVEGETIWHDGEPFRVVSVAQDERTAMLTVVVERESPGAPPPRSPPLSP
jgi:hypothetical protein